MTSARTDYSLGGVQRNTVQEKDNPTAGVEKKTISARKDVWAVYAKKYVVIEFARVTSYATASITL